MGTRHSTGRLAEQHDMTPPWLTRVIPGIGWIRGYQRAWVWSDLLAGVTVAAVIVPIAMAYGQLSGLPAVVGIYASLLPLVMYPLFGSSRLLILGPDTSTAALVVAAVAPLAAGDLPRYAALASTLAILVGLLCILAGVVRLGFVANFLSKPILVGYMNGLAFTVIASQLGKMTGIRIQADTFVGQVSEFLRKLGQSHWPTALIAIGTLAIVLILKCVAPRIPGALVAVMSATVLVAVFDLTRYGVATVGAIPPGLPALRLPTITVVDLGPLFSAAIGIVLLTYSDTILNARTFAARNHYPIDSNQELIGLGVANLSAGITQGYPVSASGTRTAVNEAAGGKSQLAGVIAAVCLVAILLFFTGVLSSFPSASLGALLVAAMVGLIDLRTLGGLYRFSKREFVIALVALVGVLLIGLLEGILLAVGLSLILLIARAVRPHDAVLGDVKGFEGYHDIGDFADAETLPGLLVYRFDGPLFFANASHFRDRVLELVNESETPIVWFLLDAEAITDVDATAMEMLEGLQPELAAMDIVLAVARAKSFLREMLAQGRLLQAIGSERVFPTIRSGVAAYRLSIQATGAPQPAPNSQSQTPNGYI
ncbi:MAG TPA: sulfate permease [Ktedonobacterales bacterium]